MFGVGEKEKFGHMKTRMRALGGNSAWGDRVRVGRSAEDRPVSRGARKWGPKWAQKA